MAAGTRQYKRAVTGLKRRRLLIAAAIAVSIALVVAAVAYQSARPYEAPPLDDTAVAGEPTPPEDVGYGVGGADAESSFRIGLASRWVRADDGSLPIWFTNPSENEAYLMMRVRRTSDGKVIYKSGLLRPGEYVEALTPMVELGSELVNSEVFVYSFGPESYQSLGTLRLSGTVE